MLLIQIHKKFYDDCNVIVHIKRRCFRFLIYQNRSRKGAEGAKKKAFFIKLFRFALFARNFFISDNVCLLQYKQKNKSFNLKHFLNIHIYLCYYIKIDNSRRFSFPLSVITLFLSGVIRNFAEKIQVLI
ncbi:MAG: hypothetical protein BWK80_16430 [Desulfobacteraceae bacterium IS3]|nr:MAG: hypothetical protein BWK80_16430 [Desulfobacteraceae bacterium IS3]